MFLLEINKKVKEENILIMRTFSNDSESILNYCIEIHFFKILYSLFYLTLGYIKHISRVWA